MAQTRLEIVQILFKKFKENNIIIENEIIH